MAATASTLKKFNPEASGQNSKFFYLNILEYLGVEEHFRFISKKTFSLN
jgi:hypothetical protein